MQKAIELKKQRQTLLYNKNKKIIDLIEVELIKNGFINFQLNQLWDDSTPINFHKNEIEFYFTEIGCIVEINKEFAYISLK